MHFLKVAFRRPRPYWSTFFGWNPNKCRVISKVEGDIRSGGWYQKIERSMNTILPWYRWYHPSSRGYHPSTKNLRFFWTQNAWTWARKERQMLKMANPVRFLVRVRVGPPEGEGRYQQNPRARGRYQPYSRVRVQISYISPDFRKNLKSHISFIFPL